MEKKVKSNELGIKDFLISVVFIFLLIVFLFLNKISVLTAFVFMILSVVFNFFLVKENKFNCEFNSNSLNFKNPVTGNQRTFPLTEIKKIENLEPFRDSIKIIVHPKNGRKFVAGFDTSVTDIKEFVKCVTEELIKVNTGK